MSHFQHHHSGMCRHKPLQPTTTSIYRLSRDIVPSHYDLTIESDPDKEDFSGKVSIDVELLKPTACIKVNALGLDLSDIRLEAANGTVFAATATYDTETEMASLCFDGTAGSGKWKLAMDFAGKVGTGSSGLFCASRTDDHGVEQRILCTQLEAAEARRVFPCFDEPDLKATFKLSLILPRYHMALANGNGVCSMALPGNRKIVEFEKTVKMSTYLLAFTLGPIVSSDPVLVNGVELRVWSLPGFEEKTRFALETAAFGLDYFEKYFEIPYPHGRKLDLVAIPNFAWGGMENIGLVVCADYVLLVDNDATADHKQNQARIIMHELAHQWFGDYVTMRWWNGLWLNESFATFMASKACQAWNPAIDEWEEFCRSREKAYTADCLKQTHPIEETVENARDAIYLVDAISYEKGCSVLLQFEQFLGEDVFRRGIATYLKRHAFANTEAADLWDAIEETCRQAADPFVAGLPIRPVMDTWIRQSGHPELLVCKGVRSATVKLTQKPFRLLDVGRKTGRVWPIPVRLQAARNGTVYSGRVLVDRKTKVVDIAAVTGCPGDFDWVKVNAGGSGFYRVRYDEGLLAALTADVDRNLTAIERHNLLADAAAFLNAGLTDSAAFFALMERFVDHSSEPDLAVYATHLQGLYGLLDELGQTRFRNHLARRLLATATNSGAWPLREAKALPFTEHWKLFNLNLSPTIQKASLKVGRAWVKDASQVEAMDAALAAMILSFATEEARSVLPEAFAELRMQARGASVLDMQSYLIRLAALCSTPKRPVSPFKFFASAMLDHSLMHRGVSAAEVMDKWLEWTGQDEDGKPLTPMAIGRRLQGLKSVADAEEEKELRAHFRRFPHPPVKKEIARCLERVRAALLLKERESAKFTRRMAALKKTAA